MNPRGDATELLVAWTAGDRGALDALMPIVYDELRAIAHSHLRRERTDHTLDTSALVHESFLRLVRIERVQWNGRAHFLAIAAQAMRNILVSYAVRRNALKRGGGDQALLLTDSVGATDDDSAPTDLLDLDEALKRLEALDPRQGRVVECRFFGGMTVEETAEALSVSPKTVKRDWAMSRIWLNRELSR